MLILPPANRRLWWPFIAEKWEGHCVTRFIPPHWFPRLVHWNCSFVVTSCAQSELRYHNKSPNDVMIKAHRLFYQAHWCLFGNQCEARVPAEEGKSAPKHCCHSALVLGRLLAVRTFFRDLPLAAPIPADFFSLTHTPFFPPPGCKAPNTLNDYPQPVRAVVRHTWFVSIKNFQ